MSPSSCSKGYRNPCSTTQCLLSHSSPMWGSTWLWPSAGWKECATGWGKHPAKKAPCVSSGGEEVAEAQQAQDAEATLCLQDTAEWDHIADMRLLLVTNNLHAVWCTQNRSAPLVPASHCYWILALDRPSFGSDEVEDAQKWRGNQSVAWSLIALEWLISSYWRHKETATKIAVARLVSEHEGIITKIHNLPPGWAQSSSNQYQTHKPYQRIINFTEKKILGAMYSFIFLCVYILCILQYWVNNWYTPH